MLDLMATVISIVSGILSIIKDPKKLFQFIKRKEYRCIYWLEINSFYESRDRYILSYDAERRKIDRKIAEMKPRNFDIDPRVKNGKKLMREYLRENESRVICLMGKFKPKFEKNGKPKQIHSIGTPKFSDMNEIDIEVVLIEKITLLYKKLEENELKVPKL